MASNCSVNKEPIAIVGLSCRFPGAETPDAFWHLLRDEKDAISQVPFSRWNIEDYYDSDPSAPDKMSTRWGGFLRDVDRFDPQFFNLSPREAMTMDPQQRLLLETSWEALENANIVPQQLKGKPVGVFIGMSTHDYSALTWGKTRNEPHAATGIANCVAANRLSYFFNWTGPSLAIDTACSSSLVAIHLACQSLRNQETELALVGGVNLILAPSSTVTFSKAGLMAKDGRCKSFDAAADGYVRSEGAGVVLLKPLADAIAQGDHIHALIRGSAVNQNGTSNGLSAPNPVAQEAVLNAAYRDANIQPSQIQYVEAQGTGSKMGDYMELTALGKVLATGRSPENHCRVGSVKANIGHTEAASGMASLIKTIEILKHRQIPSQLHFQSPNPHVKFHKLPIKIQTTLTPLPAQTHPILAGVSAFGFGGTNAHIVLEEAVSKESVIENEASDRSLHLLPLSAKNQAALYELATRYQTYLQAHSNIPLGDICHTASLKRTHFKYRLALVVGSRSELQQKLSEFVEKKEISGGWHGVISGAKRKKTKNSQDTETPEISHLISHLPMDAEQPSSLHLLNRLAQDYVQGNCIDWYALYQRYSPQHNVCLPNYPFQRQRYWVESATPSALHSTSNDLSEERASSTLNKNFQQRRKKLQQQLITADSATKLDLLKLTLQQEVCDVLGLSEMPTADFQRSFAELGMDSLLSVSLTTRLHQLLGITLNSAIAVDFPSIEQLAQHLASQVPLSFADSEQDSLSNLPELQSGLPKLPLPALAKTCDRYLSTVSPLLTPTTQQKTQQAVQAFLQAQGPHLQKLLEIYNDTISTSYAERFREDEFLAIRVPLPIYQNFSILFEAPSTLLKMSWPQQMALLSSSILSCYAQIKNKTLANDSIGGVPLCMSQYEKLFGTCRRPQLSQDILYHPDKEKSSETEGEHFVVIYDNRFYVVKVAPHNNKALNQQELNQSNLCNERDLTAYLAHQFEHIINASPDKAGDDSPAANSPSAEAAVGLLTTLNRAEWAILQPALRLHNAATLSAVEDALFILCLDGESPRTADDWSQQILCGNGHNRWFDKTLQFIATPQGKWGVNIDHAPVDGLTVVRLLSEITTTLENRLETVSTAQTAKQPVSLKSRPPIQLTWDLNTDITSSLVKAEADFTALASQLKVRNVCLEGLGEGLA
ncbi:MAG: choline/carnitine O-acyltransferase, partial [Cyanobacteria bacterium P01_F01_bin.3]